MNDRLVSGGIATFACDQNTIEYSGACVCDFLSGYVGTESCAQCNSNKIIDFINSKCVDCGVGELRNSDNTCVCDIAGYFVENPETGECVCNSELHLALSTTGDACVCDQANGYFGEPGSCGLCPEAEKLNANGECVCDASRGYIKNPYKTTSDDPRCFRCSGDEYVVGGRCVTCENGMVADVMRTGCTCSETLGGVCVQGETRTSPRKFIEYYTSERKPHEVRMSWHSDARLVGIQRS